MIYQNTVIRPLLTLRPAAVVFVLMKRYELVKPTAVCLKAGEYILRLYVYRRKT